MAVRRKLVAVVMADVVGYSRLMELDEAGTHQRLRALNDEVIAPKIAAHGGRIVKTAGDGMLLEFLSATSALRCAVEVQREMAARNLQVAPEERLELRFGINLGDIIVDGDDIIGDGVNVAARIEALAEPGGICVAAAVWEQVHEDLGVEFVDAGEQQVKNISKPVHVYRVAFTPGEARRTGRAPISTWRRPGRRALGVAAVVLVGVAGVAAWQALRPGGGAGVAAAPPLRSLMIVPFTAPADDPALTAAAAQLTRDVTRAVGDGLRSVRVVPPKSAESYAGRSSDARTLGRDANVRFLVEGEVRPDGKDVAFTLRLVDTRDGKQRASARRVVDRAQLSQTDDLLRQLTYSTRVMTVEAIAREAPVAGTAASAQDYVDRALFVSITDPVANARERIRLADAALKLDPNIARAWATRANAAAGLYYNDFSADPARLRADADADSLRAVSVDPRDVDAWLARAEALRIAGNMQAALTANDQAQELDPMRAGTLVERAWTYLDAGNPQEALKLVARLRPLVGTTNATLAMQACAAYVLLASYAEAVAECERVESGWDTWNLHANMVAAYAMHGDEAKAARAKERLMKAMPGLTLSGYEARFHPVLPPDSAAMDRATYVAGLRKAGVPE